MKEDFVLCLSTKGFHRMHYTDWGDAANPRVVICVHGLTRNGRDFDTLAQALQADFRVVCPDITGRGRSDWLDAERELCLSAVRGRHDRADRENHGGRRESHLLGRHVDGRHARHAASPGRPKTPVGKLVLNDVGTLIPKASMERIAAYVGKDPRFKTFEETVAYVRMVSAPFGPLTDAQWRHLTEHNAKQHADGSWGMNYDPGIGLPFQKGPISDIDLTGYYDAITCPTLLLRGAESDLLRHDTALAMTQRGPKPRLVEFAGVGHAPMLMAEDQIKVVRDFLLE